MSDPAQRRPKAYPPPQFPPHRPRLFARMPPAVFPALLGTLGLGLALRRAEAALGLPEGLAEVVLGAAVALWAFATFGYLVKLARRGGTLIEDLRTLPGRAGVAAASLGLLLVAAAVVPYAPTLARGVLFAGLGLHAALAGLVIWLFLKSPPEAREVTPVWHLNFVGFILGGLTAVPLGMIWLAAALLWLTMPVAVAIWAVSLVQLWRRPPPAPLRPMLAIHLAPAALFSTVATGIQAWLIALPALVLGAVLLIVLVSAGRWLAASGYSALWGAFTFPLAAFVSALFALRMDVTATLFLIAALGLIPPILYRVLKAWASGDLALRSNAAEA